jgi:secretion/DNA translocation related TadE-like protein
VTAIAGGLVAVVAALTLSIARLADGAILRSRVETAADSAALAAASALAAGRSEAAATRIAASAATANGARLLGCDCRGPGATVSVEAPLPLLRPLTGPVRAQARAELHPDCPR